MVLNWLKKRRRKRLQAQPFPDDWLAHLDAHVPQHRRLDQRLQDRLRADIQVLTAEKHWEGCAGLVMTDEIKVTIAAWGCLLILNRPHDYYHRMESILVYPAKYLAPHRELIGGRFTLEGSSWRLGEVLDRGPLVLSWPDVVSAGQRGAGCSNVALHEFAHLLDMDAGGADGVPPMESTEQLRRWNEVMQAEYAEFVRRSNLGRVTLLDDYAATSPAEFFAVATEAFFSCPRAFALRHPSLYHVLCECYRQDPAVWPE